MFALHETTRKRICRWAFFALCMAPTVATASWIGSHYAPGRKGRIARELGRELGAQVKLINWRTPRPRAASSAGVTVSDAASGHTLLTMAGFAMLDRDGTQQLSAKRVEIHLEQLPRLASNASQWLARAPRSVIELLTIEAAFRLTGPDSPEAFLLRNVRGRVDRDEAGRVRLKLVADVTNGSAATAATTVALTLQPSTEEDASAPVVEIQSVASAIPASVLAPFVPGFNRLGDDAVFQGTVRWSIDSRGVAVSVEGAVKGVDFAGVLPAGSPHELRGVGTLDLTEWRWRGEKLERISGTAQIEAGQVSRSLVEAAITKLYCQHKSAGLAAPADRVMLPLDLLAVSFELDRRGLVFNGMCPIEAAGLEGCVAVSEGQPLLVEPAYDSEAFQVPDGGEFRFHLAHLVQALAAPTAIGLPASQEAIEISKPLPLPPSTPSK